MKPSATAKAETARQARLTELDAEKLVMIGYLKHKVQVKDWHGVQDAASDLRDIEAEIVGLKFAGDES